MRRSAAADQHILRSAVPAPPRSCAVGGQVCPGLGTNHRCLEAPGTACGHAAVTDGTLPGHPHLPGTAWPSLQLTDEAADLPRVVRTAGETAAGAHPGASR